MEFIISIDRADGRPLQLQLYEIIRQMILSGKLKAGERLPSSRSVAEQLGIARITVTLAYERLLAEGYVSSRVKAGTFVNERLPDASVLVRNAHSETISPGARIRLGKSPASLAALRSFGKIARSVRNTISSSVVPTHGASRPSFGSSVHRAAPRLRARRDDRIWRSARASCFARSDCRPFESHARHRCNARSNRHHGGNPGALNCLPVFS